MFKQNNLEAKLQNMIAQKEARMNQEITIRDLYVNQVHSLDTYGEAKQLNPQDAQTSLLRLTNHIDILANITNRYHQEYYCEKIESQHGFHDQIKNDCKNKITRLLTNEFSLHTVKPLTLNELSKLLSSIKMIAKSLLPNVHLVLSSLAVVTNDHRLLNMVVYVECGPQAKLHTFCKANPHYLDVKYENTKLFCTQEDKGYPNNYIASKHGFIISNDSVFTIKTEGNAQYKQAVDICFDHYQKHSIQLFENLKNNALLNNFYIIPKQVNQVITANSIRTIEQASLLTPFCDAVHIDPLAPTPNRMENDSIDELELKKLSCIQKQGVQIKSNKDGLIIITPPFAGPYQVVATEEKKLCTYAHSLKKSVEKYNDIIKKRIVASMLNQQHVTKNYENKNVPLRPAKL